MPRGFRKNIVRNTYMARVIALSNQKGGVGKTTSAVSIASSIAAAEKRVLLILSLIHI